MKPLKLVLEGFGTYGQRQEISFDGLSLFAISGPTGSGKSLLLDAMTYALYGQTSRLGSRGLDILISPGSSRLMVELEFEAGGERWRVLRTAERKGAAGTVTRNTAVEESRDGRWVRLPDTDRLKEADVVLVRITGLDYAAFTRSVLLPQGKFDEFLQGDASSRRALLKSLLGLDILDRMREKAAELAAEARIIGGRLTEQIAADRERLEESGVSELEKLLATSRRELDAIGKELPEKSARIAELAALADLFRNREQLRSELAGLEESAGHLPDISREISQARAAAGVAGLLEAAERARRQLRSAETELAVARKREAAAAEAEASATGEQLRAQARQAEETPRLEQRVESLQEAARLAERLAGLGGSLQDDAPGTFEEPKFQELRQLQAQLPALARALQALTRAGQAETQAQRRSVELQQKAVQSAASLEELKAEGQAARAAHEQAEEVLLQDQAAHLRSNLKAGDSCPVCGGVIAGLSGAVTGGTVTADPAGAAREARALLESLRERFQAASQAHQRLESDAANAAEAALTAQQNVTAATEAVEESLAAFRQAGYDEPAAGLPEVIAAAAGSQLGALARQVREMSGGEDPATAISRVREEVAGLAAAARSAEGKLASARTEAATARADAAALERSVAGLAKSLAELDADLSAALQTSGFAGEDDARSAVRTAEQLRALEDEHTRISEGLVRVRGLLQQCDSGIAGRSDPAEELGELEAQVAADRERQAALNTAVGRQEQQLKEARERQERIREQQAELKQVETARDTYTQLGRDLHSNQFLDFLLSGVQRDLALRASHIIRQVTSGRLDLHLGDDGSFEVSDSAAGEITRRPARSLSGGETFIASLALALALAETVTGSRSLGALFLDEGFGTLDPDMLDQVTGVLENLTLVGRMVGIVTHVQDLSERLPARLLVTRTEAGSMAAWED